MSTANEKLSTALLVTSSVVISGTETDTATTVKPRRRKLFNSLPSSFQCPCCVSATTEFKISIQVV